MTGTALRYMGMFSSDFSATQADEQTTMPAGATLANLQVRVQSAAGIALQGWTITVEKNGVATALTCTLLGSATTCSNTVGSVPFASGDKARHQHPRHRPDDGIAGLRALGRVVPVAADAFSASGMVPS